jgi:hypothetical protein
LDNAASNAAEIDLHDAHVICAALHNVIDIPLPVSENPTAPKSICPHDMSLHESLHGGDLLSLSRKLSASLLHS